jgi:small nuclear ribonucleoprotein (snRNP)-like protein
MAHDDGTASLDRPSLRRRLEAYYSVVAPDLLRTLEDSRRRRQPRTTGGESRRTTRSAAASSPASAAAASASATPVPLPSWPERFEQIYAKYGGTAEGERRLASKLAKKYGASVRLQTAGGAGDGVPAVSAAAPATTRSPGGNIGREPLPGPGGAPSSDRPSGRPPNDALDFASESFDPRAALLEATAEQVRRANRGELPAGARDRVERCACLLPPADPLFRPPPARPPPPPSSSSAAAARRARDAGPARRPATRRASDAASAYFRALAAPLEAGPLSVLHRAVARRQRVRVLVRYVDGIRGTVTGFLVAFDRHFNLLLRDAEEVYSPRLAPSCRGAGGHSRRPSGLPDAPEAAPMSNADAELLRRRMASVAGASAAAAAGTKGGTAGAKTDGASPDESASGAGAPRFPAWSVRRRHLKQVLVRGDNVVLVYTAGDEEGPPGPRSSPAASGRRPAIPPLSLAASPTPAPASAAGRGRGRGRRDRERRDYASAR